MLRNPSCGVQNMAVLRHILTAAPSSPRCICHRQRSATKPGTRFWGCILYSLHCVIMICLITCKSLIYQRFLVHILKIQAVSINHRKLKVLEKEQKNKAIYYEMALYQWQGQKDLNPRHAVLETAALPTELYPYIKFFLTEITMILYIYCIILSTIIISKCFYETSF